MSDNSACSSQSKRTLRIGAPAIGQEPSASSALMRWIERYSRGRFQVVGSAWYISDVGDQPVIIPSMLINELGGDYHRIFDLEFEKFEFPTSIWRYGETKCGVLLTYMRMNEDGSDWIVGVSDITIGESWKFTKEMEGSVSF